MSPSFIIIHQSWDQSGNTFDQDCTRKKILLLACDYPHDNGVSSYCHGEHKRIGDGPRGVHQHVHHRVWGDLSTRLWRGKRRFTTCLVHLQQGQIGRLHHAVRANPAGPPRTTDSWTPRLKRESGEEEAERLWSSRRLPFFTRKREKEGLRLEPHSRLLVVLLTSEQWVLFAMCMSRGSSGFRSVRRGKIKRKSWNSLLNSRIFFYCRQIHTC